MKLLIIEDERKISDTIVEYLNHEDYLCEQAFSLAQAREKICLYEYDCVLLDLMLPDGKGLSILRTLKREHPETCVIIVSAKDSLEDKVLGLEIGADDYLAKPFHLPELSMRIFAVMRRKLRSEGNILRSGGVEIDLLMKKVKVNDHELDLTKSEYELLLFLINNKSRVVSRGAIAEHLSGDMADLFDDFNFVYAHIKNLKAKLERAGLSKNAIKTFYGSGYRWVEECLMMDD